MYVYVHRYIYTYIHISIHRSLESQLSFARREAKHVQDAAVRRALLHRAEVRTHMSLSLYLSIDRSL